MNRTRSLLLGSLAISKRDEELGWLGRVVYAWKVNKTTEQAQKWKAVFKLGVRKCLLEE